MKSNVIDLESLREKRMFYRVDDIVSRIKGFYGQAYAKQSDEEIMKEITNGIRIPKKTN